MPHLKLHTFAASTDLWLEVWQSSQDRTLFVAGSHQNPDGSFSVPSLTLENSGDYFTLKFYRGEQFVSELSLEKSLQEDIFIGENPPKDAIQIFGRVTNVDDQPLANVPITIEELSWTADGLLSTPKAHLSSALDGAYQWSVPPEKTSTQWRISALDPHNEVLTTHSLNNLPSTENVLIVHSNGSGETEIDRLDKTFRRITSLHPSNLARFSDDDLWTLASQSDIAFELWEKWREAIAWTTPLQLDSWVGYVFARDGIETSDILTEFDPAEWKEVFDNAIHLQIIPQQEAETINQTIERLNLLSEEVAQQFWPNFTESSESDPAVANELAELTHDQPGLLPELMAAFRRKQLRQASDLAGLPELEQDHFFASVLAQSGFDAEQTQQIKTRWTRRLGRRYPSRTLARLFSAEGAHESLSRTLEAIDDADLRRRPVGLWLNDQPTWGESLDESERENVVETLEAIQRTLAVTGDPHEAHFLYRAGYNSAADIAIVSEAEFVERTKKQVRGPKRSQQIHQRAQQKTALATQATIALRESQIHLPYVLAGSKEQQQQLKAQFSRQAPDLAQLLNVSSTGSCEECKSMYGPSAYLFDLFSYLQSVSVDSHQRNPDGQRPKNPKQKPKSPPAKMPKKGKNKNKSQPGDRKEEIEPSHWIEAKGPKSSPAPKPKKLPAKKAKTSALKAEKKGPARHQREKAPPPKTLRDILFERRPDLANLTLTCENAHTPVQYLDLVNEILEGLVAGTVPRFNSKKTPPAQLRAAPQFVNAQAYRILAQAAYPQSLPFDYASRMANAYLQELGLSSAEVVHLVQPQDIPALPEASAILGLTPVELDLFLNPKTSLAQRFGFGQTEKKWVTSLRVVPNLIDRLQITYGDLEALLRSHYVAQPTRKLKIRLQRDLSPDIKNRTIPSLTETSLRRLWEMVRLRRSIGWSWRQQDTVLTALDAKKVDEFTLRRIAIVRRLQTRLELAPETLSLIWAKHPITNAPSVFRKNQEKNADTDLWPTNSLDRFFQLNQDGQLTHAAPKLGGEHTQALSSALRIGPSDLNSIIELLELETGHAAAFSTNAVQEIQRYVVAAQACGLSGADFARLVGLAKPTIALHLHQPESFEKLFGLAETIKNSPWTPSQLAELLGVTAIPQQQQVTTEGILSTLREAILSARASTEPPERITSVELKNWLAKILPEDIAGQVLIALDPRVAQADISSQKRFLEQRISDLFQTPENIDPLFADLASLTTDESKLQRFEANIQWLAPRILLGVRQRLEQGAFVSTLADAVGASPEFISYWWKKELAQTKPPFAAVIEETFGLGLTGAYSVDSTTPPTITRTDPVLSFDFSPAAAPTGKKTMCVRWKGWLRPRVGGTLQLEIQGTGRAKLKLADQPELSGSEKDGKPFSLVTTGMAVAADTALLPIQLEWETAMPASFKLLWRNGDGASTPIPAGYLYPEATRPEHIAAAKAAIVQLLKVATFVGGWELSQAECLWLSEAPLNSTTNAAWFPWGRLPSGAASADVTAQLFSGWVRVQEYIQFRNRAPEPKRVIDGLLDTTQMAAIMRWPAADLAVVTQSIPELRPERWLEPTKLGQRSALARLAEIMNTIRRLGLNAATLLSWAKYPMDLTRAQEIQDVVRGKLSPTEWLEVAQKRNDPLREARRDALVAYLLATPQLRQLGITSSAKLYEFLLIDVEMSACMPTSRVVQALAAIQLLVQRCLLRLEPSANQETLKNLEEWSWRSRYRVWEAARKILFYPENWLEPELRDDKTPFFREVESELLQNEVTLTSAENAFRKYLERLDEVARLDVRALCHEADGATDVYHFVARTQAMPPKYFYRRYLISNGAEAYGFGTSGSWTPWTELGVDIDSDHLRLEVYEKRLHLFWLSFSEQARMGQDNRRYAPPREAERDWAVHLHWSELQNGQWSPPLQSQSPLIVGNHGFANKAPITKYIQLTFKKGSDNWPEAIKDLIRPDPPPAAHFVMLPLRRNVLQIAAARPQWPKTAFMPEGKARDGIVGAFDLGGCRGGANPRAKGYQDPKLRRPPGFEARKGQLSCNKVSALSFSGGKLRRIQPGHSVISAAGAFDDRQGFVLQGSLGTFFVLPPAPSKQSSARRRRRIPSLQALRRTGLAQSASREGLDFDETRRLPKKSGPPSKPNSKTKPKKAPKKSAGARALLSPLFHPHVCHLLQELKLHGIAGLLQLKNQTLRPAFDFKKEYRPQGIDIPNVGIDFSTSGAYSTYNWELFFHLPILIASRLMKEGRHEEARHWFHFVFDPTAAGDAAPAPERFWMTKPLRDQVKNRRTDIGSLADRIINPPPPSKKSKKTPQPELAIQAAAWTHDPFNPHRVARLRVGAYLKNVLMRYLDNLLAWGDALFRLDTRENITEASQLYVWVANLLGPRPPEVPPAGHPKPMTFSQLTARKANDDLHFAATRLENFLIDQTIYELPAAQAQKKGAPVRLLPYFCIPENDRLNRYWDLSEDRLYKIRHCMNIEGTVRSLALFDPPLDPALAAASGGRAVGAAESGPPPTIRFLVQVERARSLARQVAALGRSLLDALIHQDQRRWLQLETNQSLQIWQHLRGEKERWLKEAELERRALEESLAISQATDKLFSQLESLQNASEKEAAKRREEVNAASTIAEVLSVAAQALFAFPAFQIGAHGAFGSPAFDAIVGGAAVGMGAQAAAKAKEMVVVSLQAKVQQAEQMGEARRRQAASEHQKVIAKREVQRASRLVEAARVREDIVRLELKRLSREFAHAQEKEHFLRSQFTGQELWGWLSGQLATIHRQLYQMAFDAARAAEHAYRFERGADRRFIGPSAWDSQKKGLLAGERLLNDLDRLDVAYHEERRELELLKRISLAQHAPLAWLALKATGVAVFDVPETIFDADHPGHYFRRIKTVRLTLRGVPPQVNGANGTLTLLQNQTRVTPSAKGNYDEGQEADPRFRRDLVPVQHIATSRPDQDGGLLEFQSTDPRYLPFEGAGAISRWRLELPQTANDFDLWDLEDVILELGITARDGGAELKEKAKVSVAQNWSRAEVPRRFLSLRAEYPAVWQAVAKNEAAVWTLEPRFPSRLSGKKVELKRAEIYLLGTGELTPKSASLSFESPQKRTANLNTWREVWPQTNVFSGSVDLQGPAGPWKVTPNNDFSALKLKDILVLLTYTARGR